MKKIVFLVADETKTDLLNNLISAELDPKGVSILYVKKGTENDLSFARKVCGKNPGMTIYDSDMPTEQLRTVHENVKSAMEQNKIHTEFYTLGKPTPFSDLCPLTTYSAVQAFRGL